MKALSTLLLLAGYTLIYAAVAQNPKTHQTFATDPWMGLVSDVYTGDTVGGANATPQTSQ
jgi:hypothetical protein